MMSCRKLSSQASCVPFSWEVRPGVSKYSTQPMSPRENDLNAHLLPSPQISFVSQLNPPRKTNTTCDQKIPPPPYMYRLPHYSKAIWCQDDPFNIALKACTKSSTVENIKMSGQRNNNVGSSKRRSSKYFFDCKHSWDCRTDNLVRLSDFLPGERFRGHTTKR